MIKGGKQGRGGILNGIITMPWIACLGTSLLKSLLVVVDTLEDTQVQDTQTDNDQLQETEVGATSNLDTSDTTVPSPTSTDVTDASGEVATTSQGQKKGIDGTNKISSRKRKKSNFDMTGELLDKLIGMQEKSDKMMMELEMKRAWLEEKQMEIDIQMRREERE